MAFSLEEPHPGHDEEVMRPTVAELMPPVLANNFTLVNLINGPEMSIAFFVEEDGLEDVFLKGDLGRELSLVVGAIKAHFQFSEILLIVSDEIHCFEVVFGEVATGLGVDSVDLRDCDVLRVEVLVVLLHVFGVLRIVASV